MWRRWARQLGSVMILPALAGVLTLAAALLEGEDAGHRTDPVVELIAGLEALPPAPTTTTSSTRPPRQTRAARTARMPGPIATAGTVNGYPCGGELPPCWVLRRESNGRPTAVNPRGCSARITGGCGGLWQFDPRTWVGCWCSGWASMTYRGYARAELAPAEVQNARAAEVWAGGRGCGNWAAC